MDLIGGRQPLSDVLETYRTAWDQYVVKNIEQPLLSSIMVTTISWKVSDADMLFKNLQLLASNTTQVHIGTVDDRFIATVVLKVPYAEFPLVKILQRRPGSNDLLGFDSIDYLVPSTNDTFHALQGLKDSEAQIERNDNHAWVSLRFGDRHEYEAKFMDHLVLRVAQQEIADQERELLLSLGVA